MFSKDPNLDIPVILKFSQTKSDLESFIAPVVVVYSHEFFSSISPFFNGVIQSGFSECQLIQINKIVNPELAELCPFIVGRWCYSVTLQDFIADDFIKIVRATCLLLSLDFRKTCSMKKLEISLSRKVCIGDLVIFWTVNRPREQNIYDFETTSHMDELNTFIDYSLSSCYSLVDDEIEINCKCNLDQLLDSPPIYWVRTFAICSKYLAEALCDLCCIHLLNMLDNVHDYANTIPTNTDTSIYYPAANSISSFNINTLENGIYKSFPNYTDGLINSYWRNLPDLLWIPFFYSIVCSISSTSCSDSSDSRINNPSISDLFSSVASRSLSSNNNNLCFPNYFEKIYKFDYDFPEVSYNYENLKVRKYSNKRFFKLERQNSSSDTEYPFSRSQISQSKDKFLNIYQRGIEFNSIDNLEDVDTVPHESKIHVAESSIRLVISSSGLLRFASGISYQLFNYIFSAITSKKSLNNLQNSENINEFLVKLYNKIAFDRMFIPDVIQTSENNSGGSEEKPSAVQIPDEYFELKDFLELIDFDCSVWECFEKDIIYEYNKQFDQ
ncbi:hypothetical protein AYI70_g8275 [Smittium culicis]|uniref:Uncharacterized protein n=1 Tax=Smittium culicis TaxID=133412 RepID=A0A1R1XGS6_9FUNG|nr:hypothetical protein AYI70_g8275 [Smittium culicis]